MIKKQTDHYIKTSPICGSIIEILSNRDNPHIDIAMALDIRATKAHYHTKFEEIYFVIDGGVSLRLYDPKINETKECSLTANELIVIAPGVHHKITNASEKNRLCIICVPGFDPTDEYLSDKI